MAKKYIIKILPVLLAVLILASCLQTPEVPEQTAEHTGAPETAAPSEDGEFSEIDDYVRHLAEGSDFEGRSFVYLDGEGPLEGEEEETGNTVNDALYYRMREIEEIFGINFINEILYPGSNLQWVGDEVIINDVMAGGDSFNMFHGSMISTIKTIVMRQCAYDINKMDMIDLTNEWWAPDQYDYFSISDSIYFAAGPIVTSYYLDAFCLMFSKTVAGNYGIDPKALYDAAAAGTWTYDMMIGTASAIPDNQTGNGTYGIGDPKGLAILYSSGMTLLRFNEDCEPYVEPDLPRELSDLADRVSSYMGDETKTAVIFNANNERYDRIEDKFGYDNFNEMFDDDRILFMYGDTGDASALREYDVEFGILPIPKYYSDQDRYYSLANDWGSRVVIFPKSISDPEFTGTIAEATAALSLKYIRPAVYEKVLKGRSVYDFESRDMIDIIMASKVYDMIHIFADGDINTYGPFVRTVDESIDEDSSDLASGYRVYAKLVNQNISRIVAQIGKDS